MCESLERLEHFGVEVAAGGAGWQGRESVMAALQSRLNNNTGRREWTDAVLRARTQCEADSLTSLMRDQRADLGSLSTIVQREWSLLQNRILQIGNCFTGHHEIYHERQESSEHN